MRQLTGTSNLREGSYSSEGSGRKQIIESMSKIAWEVF